MPKVTITLLGRDYPINCPAGQEARVEQLAAMVRDAASQVSGNAVNMTEARVFLLAAMMLADKLLESQDNFDQQQEAEQEMLYGAVQQLRHKVSHLVSVAGRA